jgi:hypothetical protein
MTRRIAQVLPVLLLLFFGVALYAQDSMGDKSDSKMKTVTGCLQKGMESGGYTLAGEDGKIWELSGKTSGLDKHVGHKVTVTGKAMSESSTDEKKIKDNESQEVAGKEHGDLKVSSVKHVSETCP